MSEEMFANCRIMGNAANIGYMKLKDDKLEMIGFHGLIDHRVKVEHKDNIVVLTPDDTLPEIDSVIFNEATLNNTVVFNFLKDYDCIGCLFVRVDGKWVQCKNLAITD